MKRRDFVTSVLAGGLTVPLMPEQDKDNDKDKEQDHGHGGNHERVEGSRATATVSFGQWKTDPPLDRYPNLSPAAANGHQLIPHQVTIKVGGTVNFIIAGLHNVNVYAPGTNPEDINTALVRPTTGVPAGVPLINDPNNRVYSGLDPSTTTRDRVEVVHFPRKGLHLVICGVFGHFVNDNMFGFVKVVGDDD